MRNLIFASLVTTLVGGVCFSTITTYPILSLAIYGIGTYFVFAIGKLEGATQMRNYFMKNNES